MFFFMFFILDFYFRFLFISVDYKSAISPGIVEKYIRTSISPYYPL